MLLQALVEKQQAIQMNDREFAEYLGISRALWEAVRNHRRAISVRVLRRVITTFPELETDVLNFLKES